MEAKSADQRSIESDPFDFDPFDLYRVFEDIRAVYLNTLERYRANRSVNKHLSGTVGSVDEPSAAQCE